MYNFHYGARVTGSESRHFDVWHIVKIGTLSVHVSAHGDCTVAKGFNQYSVACKNFKGLMFNS
jgi:hypothetical protein